MSNPAAIVELSTSRQQGIMAWGAIVYDSRSPLILIRGTMMAQQYVVTCYGRWHPPTFTRYPMTFSSRIMLDHTLYASANVCCKVYSSLGSVHSLSLTNWTHLKYDWTPLADPATAAFRRWSVANGWHGMESNSGMSSLFSLSLCLDVLFRVSPSTIILHTELTLFSLCIMNIFSK